ncbi:MAG: PAS domain-containing sensor histidine kinase [Cyclobacteriaceae bacterium]
MSSHTRIDPDLLKELDSLRKEISLLKDLGKRKEEEISQLNHRLVSFELAASGANDGFWDWDIENDDVFVSLPWLGMLGYTETDFSNIKGLWESLLHPDDRDQAKQALADCVKGQTKNYDLNFRLRHKDGSYRWIASKGKVLRDKEGRARRISGSHTDITESRNAIKVIKENEQKYRHLFQNSLVGIVRTDAKSGEILEANQKLWEILQMEPQPGQNVINFYINPEDRADFLDALASQGNVENREIQFKRLDGSLFWASISATFYPDDQIIEAIVSDITKSKETLLELQKSNYELDHFVYHASHDLRSPLQSIMGLVNLLRIEENQSEREKCFEMIEGSVDRLDKLVIDLLNISRNNRLSNQVSDVVFVSEVNDCITNFYHASDSEDIKIVTKIFQPVTFRTDITRIRIVLNNLISNAIKYKNPHANPPYLGVTIDVDSEKATILIEDNGQGIPKSKQSQIFDMFFRATESSNGSGLGLYIVKNVVDKLGGNIKVHSQEGEGTSFEVTVPNLP